MQESLTVYLKNAPVDIPVCEEIPKYVTVADFRLSCWTEQVLQPILSVDTYSSLT